MKAYEILEAAYELLDEEETWMQFTSHRSDPETGKTAYCLSGAIHEATIRLLLPEAVRPHTVVEMEAASQFITTAHIRMASFLGECIPTWNDAPGRTHAEVLDALRLCAKHLREEDA